MRNLRKITSFLCMLSLFLWSALPLINAPKTSGPSFWLEICTAQGLERIAVEDGYNPASPEKPVHYADNNHCPLCLLRFAAILPENPVNGIILPPTAPEKPDVNITVAGQHIEILPLQPRAPPFLT